MTIKSSNLPPYWYYYFQHSCCLSFLSLDSCVINDVTMSWFQAAFLTITPQLSRPLTLESPLLQSFLNYPSSSLFPFPCCPLGFITCSSNSSSSNTPTFLPLSSCAILKWQNFGLWLNPTLSHTWASYLVIKDDRSGLAGSPQMGHQNSKGHPGSWVISWHFLCKLVLCFGFLLPSLSSNASSHQLITLPYTVLVENRSN